MPSSIANPLRILHLSDTHNLHRQIEIKFGRMPPADILIHTGDFSNDGDDKAFADFNKWLGEIRPRYRYIFICLGNHDWQATQRRVHEGRLTASEALNPQYMQRKLSNARVLNHELATIDGLTIFSSPHIPWHNCAKPGHVADKEMRKGWNGHGSHRYGEIPINTDIVCSHNPARGIFDCCNWKDSHWGSSPDLQKELLVKSAHAHFFGHLHEQRGVWLRQRREDRFKGGAEYCVKGKPFFTNKPKPSDSPCLLISCNAMKNHPGKDGLLGQIAGPPRLVIATPCDTPEGIRFEVITHGTAAYQQATPAAPMQSITAAAPPAKVARTESGSRRLVDDSSVAEFATKMAKHFDIMADVVEDTLVGLQQANPRASAEELEEQTMVILSGMCHVDSESEDESGKFPSQNEGAETALRNTSNVDRSSHRWQQDCDEAAPSPRC